MRNSLAGLERARHVIGYHPRVTLEEGLQRTWERFVDAHRLRPVMISFSGRVLS